LLERPLIGIWEVLGSNPIGTQLFLCPTLTAKISISSLSFIFCLFIHFTDSNECRIEPHKQECQMMLRCRQRCSNEYPVPNGFKECTGKFEGDTCDIGCPSGFLLEGDVIVECRNGAWVKANGQEASSHCESRD